MRIIIVEDETEIGTVVSNLICGRMAQQAQFNLGVSTGSSPLAVYSELGRRVRAGIVTFADTKAFALDEYVDLPTNHPQAYRSVLTQTVVEQLGVDPENLHVPDGCASDLDHACYAYEQAMVDAGGVDLQILGLGRNGHIGFNEPGSSFASTTHVKLLAEETRIDNKRFFEPTETLPTHSVTQGLGTILRARELVLVAHGEHKAPAVEATIEGPLTASCPGSIVQMHPKAVIVADRLAASRLKRSRYYQQVTQAELLPRFQH